MTKGDNIKKLREEKKITQTELANIIGTTKQNIYKYETGIITNIPSDKIEALAKALNTSPAHIMGWNEPKSQNEILYKNPNIIPIEKHKIPFLGEIACGEPIYADEDRESYVEAGTNVRADFCLRAKGDSMINARIYDGDIVFIRKQPIVEDGEIAAVLIEDEATLKRVYYYKKEKKLVLQTENPKHKPLVYTGDELNHIRILGKAIAFQSDL